MRPAATLGKDRQDPGEGSMQGGGIWVTVRGTVFQVERPGVKGTKLSVASF